MEQQFFPRAPIRCALHVHNERIKHCASLVRRQPSWPLEYGERLVGNAFYGRQRLVPFRHGLALG